MTDVHQRSDEVGECLIWRNAISDSGVPKASIGGRIFNVRNVVYELSGRNLRKGYVVRPTCGNPRCLACLTAISVSAMRKESMQRQLQSPLGLKMFQDRARLAGLSRIGPELAAEILASDEPTNVLAERHGVHRRSIERIRKRETWRAPRIASSVFNLAQTL